MKFILITLLLLIPIYILVLILLVKTVSKRVKKEDERIIKLMKENNYNDFEIEKELNKRRNERTKNILLSSLLFKK